MNQYQIIFKKGVIVADFRYSRAQYKLRNIFGIHVKSALIVWIEK